MDSTAPVHPLRAVQSMVGSAGVDPRPMQLSSTFNNANDGPAKIIAKGSSVQCRGDPQDDGPDFTNNEGIPIPDPARYK